MRQVSLPGPTDLMAWREAARSLLAQGVPPSEVRFSVGPGQAELFADEPPSGPSAPSPATLTVPRAFLDLAGRVVLHRDDDRFDRLYRLLWRLQSQRGLLDVLSDPEVAAARLMEKAVNRSAHKMKAFVRFRPVPTEAGERHVAWFEPAHRVAEATAGFFTRRFAALDFDILTPDVCLHWTAGRLETSAGLTRRPGLAEDADEALWLAYYASTFNPARLKPAMMRSEMPRRYWPNLAEARLIPQLIAGAQAREHAMIEATATRPARFAAKAQLRREDVMTEAEPATLEALKAAVQGCRRCPLWREATHGVSGEGPAGASLMLVGEQPGDQEDLAGRPFVGPAGRLLDTLMAEAGVPRDRIFLTNAVRHFKFLPRGKRRLHQTPNVEEISACRVWLDQELALVRPRLVMTLGATAARGVMGRPLAVTRLRGQILTRDDGLAVLPSLHPSYILRLPDAAAAAAARQALADDLARAWAHVSAQTA